MDHRVRPCEAAPHSAPALDRAAVGAFHLPTHASPRGTAAPGVVRGRAPNSLQQWAGSPADHGWALAAVRRAYRGKIELDTTERPGHTAAVRVKKQLGILSALDEFVAQQTARLDAWLAERLALYHATAYLDRFRTLDLPVVQRLVTVRREVRLTRDAAIGIDQTRLEHVAHTFDRAIARMTLYKKELWQLLTNRELLAKHVSVRAAELQALARYQSALQGDDGTGAKIAVEDLSLLLRLIELKHGGFPNAQKENDVTVYDHLVIDEAQDFGAVDLMCVERTNTSLEICSEDEDEPF